jgi:hypothetical protein
MITIAEQELVVVLNRADAGEGWITVSSTWPKWTRWFDRLVAAGLAEVQSDARVAGRREGAIYRVRADALRIGRRRRRASAGNALSRRETSPIGGVSKTEPLEKGPEAF